MQNIDDPFNPETFRLDNLVDPTVQMVPVITVVPVRKPNRQEFIRVHPGDAFQQNVALLELKEDKESYLVAGNMLPVLTGEFRPVRLHLGISRLGNTPFVWPVALPSPDGKTNTWNQSAMVAADEAMKAWVRVRSNLMQGMYEVTRAEGYADEPTWPEKNFHELLSIAFRGKTIESPDHPVVRRLQGRS